MLVHEVSQDLATSPPLGGFPANDHFILSAGEECKVIWGRWGSCGRQGLSGGLFGMTHWVVRLQGAGQPPWWVPTVIWESSLSQECLLPSRESWSLISEPGSFPTPWDQFSLWSQATATSSRKERVSEAPDPLREFWDQGSDLPRHGLGSCPGRVSLRIAGWACPVLTQSLLDPDGLCHSRTLANPSLADRPDAKFILLSGPQPRNREPGREKFGSQGCPHR